MHAAHGFDDEVRARDLVDLRQIEAIEDVERVDQRDAARGGRRARHDARAAVETDHRRALDDLVVSEVRLGPVAAELLNAGHQLLRELALVETVGTFRREQFEARGELGLLDDVAELGHFAVHEEDARRRPAS